MGLARLPAALLWPGMALLYLLLPGHRFAVFTGLPLSPAAVGVGLVLALAAWCGARPSRRLGRRIGLALAAAIGLKLLLAAVALPYGLVAEYRTGPESSPPERSTE